MATKHDATPAEHRYESLLDHGISRDKAARIVAAEGAAEPEGYDDWTDDELYRHAGELGVEDRYGMGRDELIAAIRAGSH